MKVKSDACVILNLKKKIPKLFQIQGTYTPAFARKHFL